MICFRQYWNFHLNIPLTLSQIISYLLPHSCFFVITKFTWWWHLKIRNVLDLRVRWPLSNDENSRLIIFFTYIFELNSKGVLHHRVSSKPLLIQILISSKIFSNHLFFHIRIAHIHHDLTCTRLLHFESERYYLT